MITNENKNKISKLFVLGMCAIKALNVQSLALSLNRNTDLSRLYIQLSENIPIIIL